MTTWNYDDYPMPGDGNHTCTPYDREVCSICYDYQQMANRRVFASTGAPLPRKILNLTPKEYAKLTEIIREHTTPFGIRSAERMYERLIKEFGVELFTEYRVLVRYGWVADADRITPWIETGDVLAKIATDR
jgi:hypothetical protein